MRAHVSRRLTPALSVLVAAAFLLLSAGSSVSAQVETILHSFDGGSVPHDGEFPAASLIQATDGNFYGTTEDGGSTAAAGADSGYGWGTVFKITPSGAVTILHSFGDGSVPNDGESPNATLIQATDGNFYGTTYGGGSAGWGTVFKITPSGAVTILHSFSDGSVPNDGESPDASLIQATDGNFYGTTQDGGSTASGDVNDGYGWGTVFEITSSGAVTILHSFGDGSVPNDGTIPVAGLMQATDGNFYGTTEDGGSTATTGANYSYGWGTVFKITSSGAVTILHSFGDGSVVNDGQIPSAGLIQASDGNLYGTTSDGGSTAASDDGYGLGTVFEITLSGSVTILHSFGDGSVPNDGNTPFAGLIQASDGDFYGTTYEGGSAFYGTMFEIAPSGAVTILHSFGDGTVPNDGQDPYDGLIQATNGSFYGTTDDGGSADDGTVFEFNPNAAPKPALSSISPTSAPAGSAGFALTVNGSSFASGSAVYWNGSPLSTTFVSSTHLTAAVPASLVATIGSASIIVRTPAPGGGTSAAATFTITALPPVLSSISPTSTTAGSAAFTLTVNGSKFVSKSVVRWNGTALPTTDVSATKLTATVPASSIATFGTASVTVFTSAPGGGTSAAATFTITAPSPVLSSISPTSEPAGSARFTLTVNGSKFVSKSVVRWDGTALPTTYVSSAKLTAAVPADVLTSAGTASVTVFTSAPGGGTSAAATFTVTPLAPVLSTISPTSTAAGSAAFTLTVNGSRFVSRSVVHWKGAALPTTYVSTTTLTATVAASLVATAGKASVTVFTSTPGGGTSAAATFTITATPAPSLSSISPTSTAAGSAAFILTVNGSKFIPRSVVRWKGAVLPTTYVSTTKLTATVAASLVATAGTAAVTVFTSAPGGGTSATATFTITATPAPTLSSISPTSTAAGSAAFTLTVHGSRFIPKSVVRWKGAALPTTYVSSTELTATVAASLVATAGSAAVTVFTPAPGGGTSAAATFTITATPAPVLSSISPTSTAAGSAAFILTVNGSRFVPRSVIRWNGVALSTTYVSTTKLTATVAVARVATVGTAAVTVFTSAPGGGTSAAATFTITPLAPVLSSISPASKVAGSAAFILTVNGSRFVSRSVVHWKGAALPTTYVSTTKLTATVPASLVTTAGTAAVTVFTSAPGGWTSAAATFTISK